MTGPWTVFVCHTLKLKHGVRVDDRFVDVKDCEFLIHIISLNLPILYYSKYTKIPMTQMT